MIPGFNTSVVHNQTEYHVQTEDLGEKNPCILTLVYRGGAIVSREKVNYRDALGAETSPERIKSFMDDQHRRILGRIADGAISPLAAPSPAAPSLAAPGGHPTAAAKSVDELIAEYLRSRTRRASG